MNSFFDLRSSSTDSVPADLVLINEAIDHGLFHNNNNSNNNAKRFLIIPSLASSDSSFHVGALSIVNSLRREVSAWCSSSSSSTTTKVFWSLLVANISSFEQKHFDSTFSWIIPFVAVSILKYESEISSSQNNKKSGTRRKIRSAIVNGIIAPIFSATTTAESFVQKTLLLDRPQDDEKQIQAHFEQIGSVPSRWIGLAKAFLENHNIADFIGGCHQKEETINNNNMLWQLSTTIVQALLSVWVQNRGIFVDRIKVKVVLHGKNSCHRKKYQDNDDSDSSSSSESDDDDDDDERSQQEKPVSEIINGILLPFDLGIEAKILFNRFCANKGEVAVEVKAICFTCSLDLDSCSQDEISTFVLFLKRNEIRLLICQRVISPLLRSKLAKECQTISVDRLGGLSHFPSVMQLLNHPGAIHRFEEHIFIENSENEQLVVKQCVREVKLSKEEGKLFWISASSSSKQQQQPSQQQEPTISTIVVRLPLSPSSSCLLLLGETSVVIEALVKSCVKYVSQILVDDVTMRFSAAAAGHRKTKRCSPLEISKFVLERLLLHVSSEKEPSSERNDESTSAQFLIAFLVKELEARKGFNQEKEIVDANELSEKYPECVRVALIQDLFQTAFELSQTLLSIVGVV